MLLDNEMLCKYCSVSVQRFLMLLHIMAVMYAVYITEKHNNSIYNVYADFDSTEWCFADHQL